VTEQQKTVPLISQSCKDSSHLGTQATYIRHLLVGGGYSTYGMMATWMLQWNG